MIYRTEHPKPQFMRENWTNLNGLWQFEIDHGASGAKRGLFEEEKTFSKEINVPFCPESRLSGVEYKEAAVQIQNFMLDAQKEAEEMEMGINSILSAMEELGMVVLSLEEHAKFINIDELCSYHDIGDIHVLFESYENKIESNRKKNS